VSLRPDLYIGCNVDIAAQVYGTQPLDQKVEYNVDLNPTNGPSHEVFTQDYDANPPTLPNGTWVRVTGVIDASVQGQNAFGGYVGNVPEVHISTIIQITQPEAVAEGADSGT